MSQNFNIWDVFWTNKAQTGQSIVRKGRVGGGLQLECTRVLYETLLVPVLTYGNETMLWNEKERSRIRALKIDNLRGLLGIRMMDRVPNKQMRELCGVTKG